MIAEAAQPRYLIEHTLSDFPLCGFRNFEDFCVSDNRDRVAVGVEADAFSRDVIYYDRVERL
jgi:hypothetical protein